MRDLTLPQPIGNYFAADKLDAQAVARCFNKNGAVLDEGQSHVGWDAIAGWKAQASSRYRYTATPHTLERQGRTYLVTSRVSGDFPGSPVDLRYAFTLEGDRIATLEITP